MKNIIGRLKTKLQPHLTPNTVLLNILHKTKKYKLTLNFLFKKSQIPQKEK